jgi:hypothetical protein
VTHEQRTFDFAQGERGRRLGLKVSAEKRAEVLAIARRIAVQVARGRADRTATADDVQRELLKMGWCSEDLGNAAGSIFLGWQWEQTGEWAKSERVSNHRHANRKWRLKERETVE